MKYKIAICDDSDADREYVLNMVNRWAAGAGQVVHTDTFTSAASQEQRYCSDRVHHGLLRLYLGGLRGSCTPLSDEACQGRKTLFCP